MQTGPGQCHLIILQKVLKHIVADANLHAMKIFFAFMIFALAFGGYSSASHAFGKNDCSSIFKTQANNNCDHQEHQASDQDHSKSSDKSGQSKCMDCTHCCSSSVILLHTKSYDFVFKNEILIDETRQIAASGHLFSLLRPPRTLA